MRTSLKYMSLPSSFFKQVALLQVEQDQAAARVRDELAHDPEDARREGRATRWLDSADLVLAQLLLRSSRCFSAVEQQGAALEAERAAVHSELLEREFAAAEAVGELDLACHRGRCA